MERPLFASTDGSIDGRQALAAGAIGGLVAGVGMGIVLHAALGLMPFIGTMIGIESAPVGWIVHLFISVAFGALFVPLARSGPGRELTRTIDGCLSLGVAHGAALGLVTGGVLLPIWLRYAGATGFPVPLLPIPGFAPDFDFALILSLAHLLYGLTLGGVYGYLTGARAVGAEEPAPAAGT